MKTVLFSFSRLLRPARSPRVKRFVPARLLPLLSLLLAGCIPVALVPYYRSADVISDPALVGTWKVKPDSDEGWTFAAGQDRAYDLVIADDEGSSPFIAHLFSIDGHRFLDLFPGAKAVEEANFAAFYTLALVPGHIFFRVKQTAPVLRLQVFNYEWLGKYLQEHPDAVEHRSAGKEKEARLVFTGATEGIQRFIKQHLDTPEAWSDLEPLHKVVSESPGSTR